MGKTLCLFSLLLFNFFSFFLCNFQVVGTTTGTFPGCANSGAKDNFAAILSPDGTQTFLQWGTNQDDVPTSATFHRELGKLYVAGYSLGNFSSPSSTYERTGFVTEILFAGKFLSPPPQKKTYIQQEMKWRTHSPE